jgi:hypothetical protein
LSFEIGDNVVFRHFKSEGETGVIACPDALTEADEFRVVLRNGDFYYFTAGELEHAVPPLVTVKTEQTFAITLPATARVVTGQPFTYELTEQGANQLFRALNEVL